MTQKLTLPIKYLKKYVRRNGDIAEIDFVMGLWAQCVDNDSCLHIYTGRYCKDVESPIDLVADYIEPVKEKIDPSKGHPHAALMAEYALDAAKHAEPWELWQCRHHDDEKWFPLTVSPVWLEWVQYRRKPRTIIINGHEVPEPMRVAPENGTEYWIPNLMGEDLAYKDSWDNYVFDNLMLSRGQAHSTEEAAQAHARALLSFTETK